MVTKIPPLNMMRSRYFLAVGMRAFHNSYGHVSAVVQQTRQRVLWSRTGNGMDMRYMSVTTFKINVTYRLIFEMAGWQWSGRVSLVRFCCGKVNAGSSLPGSGLICQFLWSGRQPRRIDRIVMMYVTPTATRPILIRVCMPSRPSLHNPPLV